MRSFLIFILLSGSHLIANAQCPILQRNLNSQLEHHKDLNTHNLGDGSNNYIVSGTKFTNNFTSEILFMTRVDQNTGNPIWTRDYQGYPSSRGFDVTSYQVNGQERIAVTGYVDNGQFNQVYIMIIDATNGTLTSRETFSIDPNFNSQGLHIIYTEQIYNGNVTPGFVVGGYYNFNYASNVANNSFGFVMRTDLNLNVLWTRSTNSSTSATVDFDMINHITETNDGYLVSGSSNQNSGAQQAVMTMKIDFDGAMQWQNSYIFGNNQDVATDSYFDAATNEIYVLTYYSFTHFFAITVLDNATGTINNAKSWYATGNDLNWTGFTLEPAANIIRPNDLVIFGYRRDASVINPDGTLQFGNTVPFTVSFDRTTNVISSMQWYPVPYKDPAGYNDYFAYWNGQSPLIYHPDIGFTFDMNECYFIVGNRTNQQTASWIELLRLNEVFENECEFDTYAITQNPLTGITQQTVTSAVEVGAGLGSTFTSIPYVIGKDGCSTGGILAAVDLELPEIEIFPNPTQNVLHINNVSSRNLEYSVFNIEGKALVTRHVDANSIDVSSLAEGVYFLKISEGRQTIIKKFIKH